MPSQPWTELPDFSELTKNIPPLLVWSDHDTVFAGIERENGREVFGWGSNLNEAVQNALENYEG